MPLFKLYNRNKYLHYKVQTLLKHKILDVAKAVCRSEQRGQ